ncbi:MAG: hypothetical protein CMD22_06625 [Flavobacteriales bacterium]|nr:hypothetical protein [Flavobacteriales bacterium]|tara:strand:- start:4133 stop:5026 length:894 start_codon:yes stop_codon:yes gene_type:complete
MNLKGIFQDKSSSYKLFIFICIVFLSSFLGVLLSSIISPPESEMYKPSNVFTLKMMQLIVSVFIFIIPPLFFSYLSRVNTINIFGFKNKFKRQNLLLVFLIMIFIQPFVVYCMQINTKLLYLVSDYIPLIIQNLENMEQRALELTTLFLTMNSASDLFFNLFLIALIPAFGEELFFRGVVQQYLQKILKNPHLGVCLTACVFSAIHMQFFGFLPRFLLGLILGYLFFYSGNLWMSVLGHFINNALGVLLSYSAFANKLTPDITNIEKTGINLSQAFFSVAVVLLFFYLYKQINNNVN